VKRFLGCAALLLGACVSPPLRSPPPALPGAVPLAAAGSGSEWPAREWWRGFDDQVLDTLIARALADSPDLAAAVARFDEARAAVSAARAAAGAQTGAGFEASRQRLSDDGLIPPRFLGFNWYSQFDLGINASYALDWWGRNRAAVAATVNGARAAQAERDAAAMALASSVTEIYYGWQSDVARRELAARRITSAQQRAQIASARAAAHIDRDDARQAAELDLLSMRDYDGELASSAQLRLTALAALLGCAPADLPPLAPRPLPRLRTELPGNASLDLIARRPDIVAARARVEAAARRIEVARDDFLPDLSLTALLGVSSQDLGRLLDAGSLTPAVKAAVHLPLFGAGALRAEFARSQAVLAGDVAAYRATVLTAAREVNTQLVARQRWIEQQELRTAQLGAAQALRDAAAQRAEQGIADDRAVIDATERWLALRDAQLQTQTAALNTELELIRALGGGYRSESLP
jgi:multidrug efflux system outer membrane protein